MKKIQILNRVDEGQIYDMIDNKLNEYFKKLDLHIVTNFGEFCISDGENNRLFSIVSLTVDFWKVADFAQKEYLKSVFLDCIKILNTSDGSSK